MSSRPIISPINYSCYYTQSREGEQFVQVHSLGMVLSGTMEFDDGQQKHRFVKGDIYMARKDRLLKFVKWPALGGEFKSMSIWFDEDTLRDFALEHGYGVSGVGRPSGSGVHGEGLRGDERANGADGSGNLHADGSGVHGQELRGDEQANGADGSGNLHADGSGVHGQELRGAGVGSRDVRSDLSGTPEDAGASDARMRNDARTRVRDDARVRVRDDAAFMVVAQEPPIVAFMQSLVAYEQIRSETELLRLKQKEALLLILSYYPEIKNVLFDFSPPGKIDLEEFMQKNFHFNVRLDRFAYLTGRSLSTFKRDFEKIFHQTPSRWLLHRRLQEAYRLIREQGRPASDVYLDLGFEDLSHFSYAFKKEFGQAPSRIGLDERH